MKCNKKQIIKLTQNNIKTSVNLRRSNRF